MSKAPENALFPRAARYVKQFSVAFAISPIFPKSNRANLFVFSWGELFSEHISETGFGQILKLSRGDSNEACFALSSSISVMREFSATSAIFSIFFISEIREPAKSLATRDSF